MKYFKLYENWNGESTLESLNEASIFDTKYDGSAPFVLSRPPKKNSGVDFFKKTFGKNVPNGVIHKVLPIPTKPADFVHSNTKVRGASATIYITDGKNIWELTDSESKLKTLFNHGKKNPQEIIWGENTLESAACLGLYFDPQPWINDLQSGDIPKAAKAETLAKKKLRSLLNSSKEYRGAYEILSKLNNITLTDLVKTLVLANGGHLFANAHNCKGWNFIHSSIQQYYDAEEANPTIIDPNDPDAAPGVKDNTADTIFYKGKSLDKFLKEVESESISSDTKTGLCTTKSGTQFYQISNKESAKNSQLGRIKEVIDRAYGLPVGKEKFEIELQGESIDTTDFDEAYELAVNEGLGKWIGQAVKWTKDTFTSFIAKIKEKLKAFNSSILDSLGADGTVHTTPPAPLEKFIQGEMNEGLLTEGISYSEYAKGVVSEYLNNDPKRLESLYEKVMGEWDKLDTTAGKIKGLKKSSKFSSPELPATISDETSGVKLVIKYMIDYSAYYDLNAMFISKSGEIKDSSTILDEFVDFEKEMVFGKTELPLYKLYGSDGSDKKPWTYLSSGKEFKAEKKKIINEFGSHDLPGLIVESSLQKQGHTAVYLWVFHDFNNPEGFLYTEVSFRSGNADTYSYSISGTTYKPYESLKKKIQ